jgi:hypothetical protein
MMEECSVLGVIVHHLRHILILHAYANLVGVTGWMVVWLYQSKAGYGGVAAAPATTPGVVAAPAVTTPADDDKTKEKGE